MEANYQIHDDTLAAFHRALKQEESDLGTEAVRRLFVENFPVFVVNDIYGNDLYEMGREQYQRR